MPPPPVLLTQRPCFNYSLASLLNRWLVPGTPVPDYAPYYEVMVSGNVWLPEDLLYSIAQFVPTNMVIFGTAAAGELRAFMSTGKRPLVWSNGYYSGAGEMLLDPIVGNIAGDRITDHDVQLFQTWTNVSAVSWELLVQKAGAHLHLKHPSYLLRHVCEDVEADSRNHERASG